MDSLSGAGTVGAGGVDVAGSGGGGGAGISGSAGNGSFAGGGSGGSSGAGSTGGVQGGGSGSSGTGGSGGEPALDPCELPLGFDRTVPISDSAQPCGGICDWTLDTRPLGGGNSDFPCTCAPTAPRSEGAMRVRIIPETPLLTCGVPTDAYDCLEEELNSSGELDDDMCLDGTVAVFRLAPPAPIDPHNCMKVSTRWPGWEYDLGVEFNGAGITRWSGNVDDLVLSDAPGCLVTRTIWDDDGWYPVVPIVRPRGEGAVQFVLEQAALSAGSCPLTCP